MDLLSDALQPCVALFESWGQPWALVGGAALVARIRIHPGQEAEFLERARQFGFTWEGVDAPLFIEGGLLRARSPSGDTVDFMTASDALYAQVVARAEVVELAQIRVRMATIEDLLLMKLDAGRLLDFDDAIAIKDACGARLDRAYLRQAGEHFGLLPQLENLLGGL